MDTIFMTIVMLFIGVIAVMLFIQMFKGTRIWMWYKNRKNKVKILSDMEYDQMMKSGKIVSNIIVEAEE